jgi:hypothetical protein
MPNLTLANNPVQAGFLGDYMWVEVSHHNFDQKDVHIVWADTRPLPNRLAHQPVPGRGHLLRPGQGPLGRASRTSGEAASGRPFH